MNLRNSSCFFSSFLKKDFLHAQHQSIYVPNYHRTFDYTNIDETPLSVEQDEDEEIQLNEALDLFHPVTLSSNELPWQISTDVLPSEMSTGRRKLLQNNTYSFNTTTLSSTKNEDNHFDYREPTPPFEQINQTIDNNLRDKSTPTTFLHNHTKLIVDWSNETHILRKNLRTNNPREQAARYLANQKFLQSLMHLIPPNLWEQINNNRSMIYKNQTQYTKPLLPNPVLLAEAAAQAGLPGPGPYPIPEHLWHRNPSQIITRSRTICKLNH